MWGWDVTRNQGYELSIDTDMSLLVYFLCTNIAVLFFVVDANLAYSG